MPFSWVKETMDGASITEENGMLTSDEKIKSLSIFYNRTSLKLKTNTGLFCSASKMFDMHNGQKNKLGIVIRLKSSEDLDLLYTFLGSCMYVFEPKCDETIDLSKPDVQAIKLNPNRTLEIYMNQNYMIDYKIVEK